MKRVCAVPVATPLAVCWSTVETRESPLTTYSVVVAYLAPVPVELATEYHLKGYSVVGRCGALEDAGAERVIAVGGGRALRTKRCQSIGVVVEVGGGDTVRGFLRQVAVVVV